MHPRITVTHKKLKIDAFVQKYAYNKKTTSITEY